MPPRPVAPVGVDRAFVPQSDCALPDGEPASRRALAGPLRGVRSADLTPIADPECPLKPRCRGSAGGDVDRTASPHYPHPRFLERKPDQAGPRSAA